MKRIMTLLMAVVLTLALVSLGWAADISGVVSKIDGAKVTVKTADGKETTLDSTVKGIKVGSRVVIKDGKLTKKAAEGC
jgi:hypothetical protein